MAFPAYAAETVVTRQSGIAPEFLAHREKNRSDAA
jgi:hypothetical protein